MEISSSGDASLFALKQALRQPQNIIALLEKSVIDSSQALSAPSGNAEQQKTVSGRSSSGSMINITV